MELVNQTPAAADLRVSTLEGTTFRYGMLTAKVTFCVDREGRWRIDDQDPYPVLAVDRPTALGELPGDLSPRRDRALEVIVLGAAHGGALTEMEVSLAVGGHARHLRVSGDREWLRGLGGPRISPPAAIGVMPLTWARAFGGAAECWLDERSVIDLFDPQNRRGRGFDAEAQMRDVGKAFEAPAGFPRLADGYRRLLPNIEDPRRPITRWDDAPPPACWATVPTELGVQSRRAQDRIREGRPMSQAEVLEMVYHRAHPDWVLPEAPLGAAVVVGGMSPGGRWGFHLPTLAVIADYELGERRGERALDPHLLLLLPEESRFYLVYRHFFTMEVERATPRSIRLRLAGS